MDPRMRPGHLPRRLWAVAGLRSAESSASLPPTSTPTDRIARAGFGRDRPMHRRITVLIVALAVLASATAAARPLTLESFLSRVRAGNPRFPAEDLTPEIERARRDALRAERDWRLSARGGWAYREPITVTPFAPDRVTEVDLGSTLRRELWSTGGRLDVDVSAQWTDQEVPPVEFPAPGGTQSIETGADALWRNGVALRYAQPLLRNRGGALDRLESEVAAHGVDASAFEARERQEALLLRLGLEYVAWARWHAFVGIAEDRLRVAERQLDLVRELRESNLVDRVDLLRAEAARAAARRGLSTARAELRGQTAALATLARIEELSTRRPAIALTDSVALEDRDGVVSALRTGARQLRVFDARIDAMRLRREGADATRAPSLDLDLGLGLRGGDRDDAAAAWELDAPDASVALVFRQALGAGRAEAETEAADLSLRRLHHRRQEVELDLRAEVARRRAQLHGLADALALHDEQVEAAEEAEAAERELYREGRSPLTFVLEAQDATEAARRARIETGARYHTVLLRYREVVDDLLTEPVAEEGES